LWSWRSRWPRAELEACIHPETEKKLQDDIAWAQSHHIQGTPFLFMTVGRRSRTRR
jgi:hypothetical protein